MIALLTKHKVLALVTLLIVLLAAYFASSQAVLLKLFSAADSTASEQPSMPQDSPRVINDLQQLKTFRASGIDGELKVDEQGQLIISVSIRHWMDYYLSALGELDLPEILALMQQKIDQLPEPARSQASGILQSYVSYKDQMADYDGGDAVDPMNTDSAMMFGDLKSRMDWQKRLRREHFSPQLVTEFWRVDEIIDDFTVAKMDVVSSDQTAAEKKQALAKLEQELPEDVWTIRRASRVSVEVEMQEQEIIEQGGDAQVVKEQVQQLRSEKYGDQAAQRLAELDQKQQAWQDQLLAYQNEKQRVAQLEGLSEQDKQQILQDYKQQNFTAQQLPRVEAASSLLQGTGE